MYIFLIVVHNVIHIDRLNNFFVLSDCYWLCVKESLEEHTTPHIPYLKGEIP